MSDKDDEIDKKSLVDSQIDITKNTILWYRTTFKILDTDSLSKKSYKILVRLLITLFTILFSPIILIVLIVALIGAG